MLRISLQLFYDVLADKVVKWRTNSWLKNHVLRDTESVFRCCDVLLVFLKNYTARSVSLLFMIFKGGEERKLGYVTYFLYMRFKACKKGHTGDLSYITKDSAIVHQL